MMEALQARDSIRQVNLLAFALGGMDQQKASQFSMSLQASAAMMGLKEGGRAYRPKTPQEMAALAGGSVDVVMGPGSP